MTEQELIKLVNTEIDWLRYYSFRDSKKKLNVECELYDTLESIGYTKRIIPLDRRCPAGMISTGNVFKLEQMEVVSMLRNHDKGLYTPLEVYWILYPHKRSEVIYELQRDNP